MLSGLGLPIYSWVATLPGAMVGCQVSRIPLLLLGKCTAFALSSRIYKKIMKVFRNESDAADTSGANGKFAGTFPWHAFNAWQDVRRATDREDQRHFNRGAAW